MRRGGTGSAGGRSAGGRSGGGRSGGGGPDSARLVALAALAVVALNFPLLLVWDRPASVLGLPLLGVAVFVIWAGLIARRFDAAVARLGLAVAQPPLRCDLFAPPPRAGDQLTLF